MTSDASCERMPSACLDECNRHIGCVRFEYCKRMGYAYCEETDDCEDMPPYCSEECSMFASCLLCDDSCNFWDDEECDDGGDGSSYAVCPIGSDCKDCGVRTSDIPSPSILLSPSPSPPNPNALCKWLPASCTTCLAHVRCLQYIYCSVHSNENCEHMGSFSGACKQAPPYCLLNCAPYASCFICTDSCDFNGDNECDDGGDGSTYTSCPIGTDCTDCGARGGSFLSWDGFPHSPPSTILHSPPQLPPPSPPVHVPLSQTSRNSAGEVFGWVVLTAVLLIGLGCSFRYRKRILRMMIITRANTATNVPLASHDIVTNFRQADVPAM